MARLFFGLWPDSQLRTEIQTFASQLSLDTGRLVASTNTHITLVFLGNVDELSCTALKKGAARLSIKPFSLRLDRLGWWSKPKIAWLAPTEQPAELIQLASELASLARRCGLSLEERPYKPHLTLARKVKNPLQEASVQPISWNINEFCLLESISTPAGIEYQVKESWKLKIM